MLLKALLSKFRKADPVEGEEVSQEVEAKSLSTWFNDRYESIVTQRNVMIVITLLSFLVVSIAIVIVGQISTSKTFEPFVIQIEEKTGTAKIVNPSDSELLSGNEALTRYFIKKYLIARETYNPVDFDTNVRKTVRLFSSGSVYRDFIGFIRSPNNDPSAIYAQKNSTYLRIKSFTKLDNKYLIRFSVVENAGSQNSFEKIATLTIAYVPMELNEDDRDINPVGFQITGYRVDDDRS